MSGAMVDLVARLGLRYPIVQAPMAGVQGSRLAVAVSEAGGLGSLPAAMLDAPALEAELTTIRARTGRPVNINFFCHALPADDEARQRAWHAALAPYYREFGLERRDAPDGASRPASSRRPFDHDMADVLAPFRPAVVSFHFGLPAAALVDRLRASGTIVLDGSTLSYHGLEPITQSGLAANLVLTLGGADAANYAFTIQPPVAATITPKPLTMSGLTTPGTKTYDGTTAATVSGTGILAGVVGADAVSLGGTAVGVFDSPDVATASAPKSGNAGSKMRGVLDCGKNTANR